MLYINVASPAKELTFGWVTNRMLRRALVTRIAQEGRHIPSTDMITFRRSTAAPCSARSIDGRMISGGLGEETLT